MKQHSLLAKSDVKTPFLVMGQASLAALSKNSFVIPALLFLISFLLFAVLSPRVLSNGDAALYAQQIRDLDFAHRTVHLGYYLIGIPFVHFIPIPSDVALNLMNCLFGALCVSALFLITLFITGSKPASCMACLMLITNHLFVSQSVFAEVYVPQLFFFLLSIVLLLVNRPVSAGLSFGISCLITPSGLFGCAMLIPFRRNNKILVRFIISALAIILVMLSPNLSDYILGGRGLLKASHASLSIGSAFFKENREFFSGMLWYVPFMLAGVIEIVRYRKYREWGLSILLLWLLTFISGERFGDVPVQLPCYAFVCMIGGLGCKSAITSFYEKRRTITVVVFLYFLLAVILTGFTSLNRIHETSARHQHYRDTVFALRRVAQPGFIALGPWTQGILFEHYLYGKSYTGMWINTEWLAGVWGAALRDESREKLSQALLEGRDIWVLDYDTLLFAQLQKQGYRIYPFKSIFRASPAPTQDSKHTS